MLSYLTTAFSNHVRIREQFNYKVNDAMWAFFQRIDIIDEKGKPTQHFGDPLWVYYQYLLAKNDLRTKQEIYAEGKKLIAEIRSRGVPIAEGFGDNIWDLKPELDQQIHELYEDAKVSIWSAWTPNFLKSISNVVPVYTNSVDRKDYVYHPKSGEQLSTASVSQLQNLTLLWGNQSPDLQIVISDGLNARALMDEGHLKPYLSLLKKSLQKKGYAISKENIVITYGRVRAGYQCGEALFGHSPSSKKAKGIIHIIGERPGSGHHNFSAYLSAPSIGTWSQKGKLDHNNSRVVSGISDTALSPELAVQETVSIFSELFAQAT
jgi:ethanolamine ammonia-lyase large subunit